MYKFLLCCRYLRTRYIALASIVSVMLGVATMIVVNAVMSGFTTEMQNRIHGILSDVVVEARNLDGFPNADWHIEQIRAVAGQWIEGMSATVVVPAMLSFPLGDGWHTRQVQLIGIDEKTQSQVSDFSKYLQHPENRRQLSFGLRTGGYDTRDHQSGPEAPERAQMTQAGWEHRLAMAKMRALQRRLMDRQKMAAGPVDAPAKPVSEDPFREAAAKEQENVFDPARQQHPGVVLGIAIVSFRNREGKDRFLALPGDDVTLTVPRNLSSYEPLKGISLNFTVVDFYESKMSEYDQSFVFVPIQTLQQMRGMIDPQSGIANVNSIQIKLKPGADDVQVRDKLRALLPNEVYGVYTWRDKQGALLAAVQMETAILNVLLFLIIAVSGFGILAIFFMIVVEKTRDIGVLKSLGAPGAGIMNIFLAYGLSLGLVGSGVGLAIGLAIVRYINEIAALLGKVTGRPVFDPAIYYFYKIPTIVDPFTILWIVVGAMVIAVLASVLPALRAALLHPVEALRYE
jgi:lipoprotein-releasing system permease protein